MYGVPYIFRYFRERFSSIDTSTSRFFRIMSPHKCTSPLTLEGSRTVLVVIFKSVSIRRFLGEKIYGVPYIFRYFRERFSSKRTSKSRFVPITRPHKCTSQLAFEGSRSALVVIFVSVSIWRFLGKKCIGFRIVFATLENGFRPKTCQNRDFSGSRDPTNTSLS